MSPVPEIRVRNGNGKATNPEGAFVLYWMTAFRRLGWNFALQHAVDLAQAMGKPLVILETLFVDYPHASHRLHRFMLEGMAERSRALAGTAVRHYPFAERTPGEGLALVEALASRACRVVTDDWPSFFLPRMVQTAGARFPVCLELVDSNGLMPLGSVDRTYKAAYHFRRFLQKNLSDHLFEAPDPDPLSRPLPSAADAIPQEIPERWPAARGPLLEGEASALRELPLDEAIPPVVQGGRTADARRALARFLDGGLGRYHEDRNHPDAEATSGLSPHLHFGTISTHEIFKEVADREGWTPLRISGQTDGSREGWWGMGPGAEAFLDQLVTWRELGFNMSSRRDDYAAYESLPEWARQTLERHEADPRTAIYTLSELQAAATSDPLWNAAQRQLLEEGVIHNYLRMLWGKRILEWRPTAADALDVMIQLNDSLAVDGRDPNSYSGIFWCLGRYDRGWPERPIFGKVRSMTSSSTRRKIHLSRYLERFGEAGR